MTPKLQVLSDEQFPDFLTDTDVARIFRHVYGGQQFDSTERMFAAEVEAAVRAKFRDALAALAQQAQEPVAYPSIESLTDAISKALNLTWHCHRVWGSWHVGTMSEADFSPVDESDTPREIAEIVSALYTTPPAPQLKGFDDEQPDPVPELQNSTVSADSTVLVEVPRLRADFQGGLVTAPCAGMNCGTAIFEHSPECEAEHAAACAGGVFTKSPPAPQAPAPVDEREAWLPIEADTVPDRSKPLFWLLVDGSPVLGYFVEIPFREIRDADGRYIDQQDADAFWATQATGDQVEPTHYCELMPPTAPQTKGQP